MQTTLIENLEKEVKRMYKENERLQNQIETCEDMIHNHTLKLNKNNESIIFTEEIIKIAKERSLLF